MAPAVAKAATAIAGGAKTAATATAAAAASVPDGRRTSRRVLARPTRIVNRQVGTASQAAWSLIVTLLALSLLAMVLRIATTRPGVVESMLGYVPNALRKFVNPFGDNPLAARPTTKKKATP